MASAGVMGEKVSSCQFSVGRDESEEVEFVFVISLLK
jgi:hypothetical protein